MPRFATSFSLALLASCSTAPAPLLPLPANEFQDLAIANQLAANAYWELAVSTAISQAPNFAVVESQAAIARELRLGHAASRDGDAIASDAAHSEAARAPMAVEAELASLDEEIERLHVARACVLENLANLRTDGYRRRLAPTEANGAATIDGNAGCLRETDRPLDLAIDGAGYFVGRSHDGELRYTRNGSLHIDSDGRMVFANGTRLEPEISVPADTLDIVIDASGTVRVVIAGSPDASQTIGQIELAHFAFPHHLAPVDARWFAAQPHCGAAIVANPGTHPLGVVRQRYLETSNCQVVREVCALRDVDTRLVEAHTRRGWLRPEPQPVRTAAATK